MKATRVLLLCAAACLLLTGARAEDEGSTEPCAEVDPDSGGCIQPDPPVDGGDGGSEPGILPAPGGTEGGGEGEGEDDVFEGGEGEDDGFEGGEGEVVEGEGGEGGEGSEGGSGTSDCDTDPTGPDCPQVDDGEGGGIGGDPDCVPDPDTNEVPDKCLMYMNEESPACTKGPNGVVKCKDNVRGPTGGARGCSCIELWAPVCGADGKVYANACKARCAKVSAKYKCSTKRLGYAACKKRCAAAAKPPGCVCPMIWAPVCGRDGKVYDNDCFARCAKAKPAFQCGINMAACKKECKCRSACGTNKACVAKCKPAKPRPKPICICGKVYAPVCAKNGRVYNNPCLAKCAKTSIKSRCESKNTKLCARKCKKGGW
ncbi:hypothetical protein CHLNCDRAFT_133265 [Chlorella variabilis]|uniref:Kazal-like domain-containing protein n=1 Tax=Chlorella variabilis TaxID=554065 RepID=E1Z2R0_CHLVA|nr:hypothetical protein CHLNCDRAFT_133265 [Chlorella variabilis]EFN59707.1 hypothetical protein CHLNCDRAFT_133265 [Chlorella variabilis]|eukprot:XP_005851809.1 hypothetical protein CHLNCDRAFT_133265 [Chlorella variabilis]